MADVQKEMEEAEARKVLADLREKWLKDQKKWLASENQWMSDGGKLAMDAWLGEIDKKLLRKEEIKKLIKVKREALQCDDGKVDKDVIKVEIVELEKEEQELMACYGVSSDD